MGGKNNSPPPPPVDNSANEAMLAQIAMMSQMIPQMAMAQQQQMAGMISQMQQQQQPMLPMLPPVYSSPEVDWTEKIGELKHKAQANYTLDQARKVGRSATILTSPFLEDEDANVTGSILE